VPLLNGGFDILRWHRADLVRRIEKPAPFPAICRVVNVPAHDHEPVGHGVDESDTVKVTVVSAGDGDEARGSGVGGGHDYEKLSIWSTSSMSSGRAILSRPLRRIRSERPG
jgi:hypothetical protein